MAWIWPSVCKTISQGYGVKNSRYVKGYHTGIDIACPNGSPVRAVTDGTITFAGWNGPYGNQVKQKVGNAELWYNHFSKMVVKPGQGVTQGTIIGYEGTTGQSTGPHLHFEVRIGGKDVDPMPYLGGSKVIPAGDSTGNGQQVIDNPLATVGKLKEFFDLLSDTITWMRVGMVLGGGVILIMAFVGIAKTKALGSVVAKKVVSGGKSSGGGAGKPGPGAGGN